ncbi:MAG: transglycosylase domain-containing protein [Bacilli bacterium]|nr:transglycosylase domain-containing protein [Bacilli bacterium]
MAKNKKIGKLIKKNRSLLIVILLVLITSIVLYFKLGLIPTLIISLFIIMFLNLIPIVKKMRKTKKGRKKLLNITLGTISTLGIIVLLAFILGGAYIIIAAPDFKPDNLYKKEATIIYDKDNEIFAKLGLENREKISFDDLPQVLVDAIIATEDSRYFQHNGFDLPRFVKASLGQVAGNSGAGGASTLSMQVVKNNFTGSKQTLTRKFTDIYLSIFKLEKKYTKEEIIEFYVNTPWLGNNAHGVEQASQTFFNKSVRDINLAEASLIAGLFQAPGAYDPFIYPEKANNRRLTVLSLMKKHGYITEEERQIARAIPIETLLVKSTASGQNEFQGYINTVIEEVRGKTGNNPYNIPMKIYTNMDRERQLHINKVMAGEIHKFENDVVQTGIAVIESKTGHLVAVGANRDLAGKLNYNYATMIKKQPGSTAKPLFDYAPGMEYNNWSTYTPFVDIPHQYTGGKTIKNWDGKFMGFMTLREALDQSRNTPALLAFQQLSNKKIKEFVESVGLKPETDNGKVHEAHSLGAYNGTNPVQLAGAYAAFANGGYYIEPFTVSKIEYRDTGEIKDFKPKINKVMSDSTAFMISDILLNSVEYGFNNSLKINGVKVAGKTGTTNFDKETMARYKLPRGATNDAWVAGFNPDYTVAFWYGYDEISSKYYNTTNTAWRARNGIFKAVGSGIFIKNNKGFEVPNSVVRVKVERGTVPAMLASEFTPKEFIVNEYFKKGTEPTDISPRFDKIKGTVTSLDINYQNGAYKLTWDVITKPDYLTGEYFTDRYKTFYRSTPHFNSALEKYLVKNEEYLGTFGYNVYSVNNNDELTFIAFTENNSFSHTVSLVDSKTYVVKAGYSKTRDLDSNGARITYNNTDPVSLIEMKLNGENNITIKIGETFTEPQPTILVFENLNDVSGGAIVTKTIENIATGGIYDEIDTSTPAVFKIVYKATYKDKTETFERIVTVE